MIPSALTFGQALAAAGPSFILGVFCAILMYAYNAERKRNDRLHIEIQANSKEMVVAFGGVQQAIQGFRDSMLTVAMLQQRVETRATVQQAADNRKEGKP